MQTRLRKASALFSFQPAQPSTADANLEATGPFDQTTGSGLVSDASSSNPLTLGTLPKGDRLDVADADDAVKPVRPIAIMPKVAEALPVEASEPERSWRSSYAKRQASVGKSSHDEDGYSRLPARRCSSS